MNESDAPWALIQMLFFYITVVPPTVKVVGKTGLSRWLALPLVLGPIGSFILFPILAIREWKEISEENT